MDTDFIVLSESVGKAMVRCNCGHVQEIEFKGEIQDITILCETCGCRGEVI
jgi:hypothetical protein